MTAPGVMPYLSPDEIDRAVHEAEDIVDVPCPGCGSERWTKCVAYYHPDSEGSCPQRAALAGAALVVQRVMAGLAPRAEQVAS